MSLYTLASGSDTTQIDSNTNEILSVGGTNIASVSATGLSVNTGSLSIAAASNQLIFGSGSTTLAFNVSVPASGNRVYSIPDTGSNSSFIMSGNIAQTIGGLKTFSLTLQSGATSNQIRLGTGSTSIYLSAPPPATGNPVYTIPDAGGNTSFILADSAQTFIGQKTFSTSIPITATSNQLIFGSATTTTINATSPVANQTITIPDSGVAASDFVLTDGNQTINGVKTFSSGLAVTGSLTASSYSATATTNQLVFGTTNTTTINSVAPLASQTITIPDSGVSTSSFILGDSATQQSINSDLRIGAYVQKNLSVNGNLQVISGNIQYGVTTPKRRIGFTGTDTGTASVQIYGSDNLGNEVLNASFNDSSQFAAVSNILHGCQQITGSSNGIMILGPNTSNTNTQRRIQCTDWSGTTLMNLISGYFPTSTNNEIRIGGGFSANTCSITTAIYAAGNNATTSGTRMLYVTSSGVWVESGKFTVNQTSNQIVLGTTNTTTISSVAPVASQTLTIPDSGVASSNFVLTDGNQTVNGVKTFSSGIPIGATTNQLVFGTTNTTTINSVAPASSRVYTIPDSGANSSFVMTDGAQTINGSRTFSSSVAITPTTNQLVLGTTNTTTVNATAPTASRVYTIPDSGANSNFVMTDGAQTVNGSKSFSSGIPITATSNQLVLSGTASFTYTITTSAPTASRVYTITDVGGAANFIMSAGNQTLGGSKTFSSAITVSPTTNQLVLGATRTVTITAPTPATASRIHTIPDVGANANFVMSEAAQTINGAKTLSAALTVNPTTNQLVLGVTRTVTINATQPATASRVYTIPDAGANASFLMSEAAQTINGAKTFSSGIPITATTNQLVLGGSVNTTINAVTPAANAVYTIPDVGTTSSFIMADGAQTINGVKTFANGLVNSGTSTALNFIATATTNQLRMGTTNTTTINSVAPVSSQVVAIPDSGVASSSFVLTDGNQTINGVKTFSSGVPITATTNQLVLGTGTTTTVNSVAPASSQVVTIPDSSVASTKFILSDGPNQSYQYINTGLVVDNTILLNNSGITYGANTGYINVASDPNANNNAALKFRSAGPTTNGHQFQIAQTAGFGIPTVDGFYLTDDIAYDTVITNNYSVGTPAIRFGFDSDTLPSKVSTFIIQSAGIKSIVPVTITPTTNQLILGTTTTTTINAVPPTSSQVLTIPDSKVSASNFILSNGGVDIPVVGPSYSVPEKGQVVNGTLQLTSAYTPLVFGTNTANTTKTSRIVGWDYAGTNQFCGLMMYSNNSTTNLIAIGGGTGGSSGATTVNIHAASSVTATASLIASFTTSGVSIGTGSLRLNGSSDDKFVTGSTAANTIKTNRFLASDYAGSGYWSFIFPYSPSAASNRLLIGGGSSAYNASTGIEFYAASNTTTLTGTLVASMDTTGITTSGQLISSATSNQLKLGAATINCTNQPRTFTISDPYVSTGIVTNLIVSLTNTTARPAIQSYSNDNWNPWEIRGTSQQSTGNDDGFIRIRAGGASAPTSASWIDVSGASTVSDMHKNIVFGCGAEIARFTSTGLLFASGTNVSLPVSTASASWQGAITTGTISLRYQVISNCVYLTILGTGLGLSATANSTLFFTLPASLLPNATAGGSSSAVLYFPIYIKVGGVGRVTGSNIALGTGRFTIYKDQALSGFTSGDNILIDTINIQYMLT